MGASMGASRIEPRGESPMWALFLATVVAIELARRLPLVASFRRLAKASARAGRIVTTAPTDGRNARCDPRRRA